MANTNKIEKAAVRAVEEYLDECPMLESFINTNDKTPIWDGDIYVYINDNHKNENFFARVPLQVKGTTIVDGNPFRIDRKYLEGYKAERGTAFFMVKKNKYSAKVFYALLSLKVIDILLQTTTKTIKIPLQEAPTDPLVFEQELYTFATNRNNEKIESSSPNEIHVLVEEFEDVREYLEEIEDTKIRYDLESLLDSIKNLRNDGSVGWRDKFIYYSQKALDLATNNINGRDFEYLQFNLGKYLNEQKQYRLAEKQYVDSLKKYRKNVEEPTTTNVYNLAINMLNMANLHRNLNHFDDAEREYKKVLKAFVELANHNRDAYIGDVAMTLNNLAILHDDLYRYDESEWEYKAALKIRRELALTNRDAHIGNVAQILNNLAALHFKFDCFDEAEKEWEEALKIYRELAENNHDAYIGDVAQILNNLAALHFQFDRFDEAEEEYKEALKIRRELAKNNRDAYIGDVAQTLNNLAILYQNSNRYEEAKIDYMEALDIYQELAEANHDAYIGLVAQTLNNLALLHTELSHYNEAEKEYEEALNIEMELAKTNRDVYVGEVAKTLESIARLQAVSDRKDEAKKTAEEALGIYKELAEACPQIWNRYVEKTERLLNSLEGTRSLSLLSHLIAFLTNKRSL